MKLLSVAALTLIPTLTLKVKFDACNMPSRKLHAISATSGIGTSKIAFETTDKSVLDNNEIRKCCVLVLFASLQVCNLDLVEEPSLQFSMSGVVVPDTQEGERSETALSAQDEVQDTSSCQLLYNKESFQTDDKNLPMIVKVFFLV